MKILVIGGGGREHALIRALRRSLRTTEIFALPGNGGIAGEAVCVPIKATDIPEIVRFARETSIDLAVVAPDDPLVLGAVDALEEAGIPCFGPNKKAAIIEGSKVFSKDLMKKYGIPTAEYAVFTEAEAALSYLEAAPMPTVIKADGLALGKGVVIAKNLQEAKAAVREMMEDKVFGESGSRIVIEEFLEGPEVSVLSFTDGRSLVPMVSSMDHKRALDNDEGKNTGGMGAVAPNPYYTEALAKECMETIFLPTIRAMEAEGRLFKGCLFFGLMLTNKGPKAIEYNCRFGDPETQAVLPLLEGDLVDIMISTRNGTLAETPIQFAQGASCCVIAASGGYPEKYESGFEIHLPESSAPDTEIYIAGAKLSGGKLLTSGGRVLGLTAVAEDLQTAVQRAYAALEAVQFEKMHYRKDIGARALLVCGKEN